MRWDGPDGHFVDDDRTFVDVERVHRWLSEQSYWAAGRELDVVRRSIEQSLTLGLYSPSGEQLGVCRWVTDYETFAWLADVFVDEAVRGRGLGVFLVSCAAGHPKVCDVPLQLLGTRDAHDIYRKVGFVPVPEPWRWMERRR